MKKLKIKLTGAYDKVVRVRVNGDEVRFKRNNFGSLEAEADLQNDIAQIEVYKYNEIMGAYWLLAGIFFFIISVFGILSPCYDRRCIAYDCKFAVKPKDDIGNVMLSFYTPKKHETDGCACDITSDCEVDVHSNRMYVDPVARRRIKIATAVKLFIFAASVAATVIVLVNIF